MIPENINLGYACINTFLRQQKPPIFCSRTCRISTIQKKSIEYVKKLAIQNLKDLLKILEWNLEHKIFFFRVSSDLFPFASHPIYGYNIDFADEFLLEIGDYAKKNKIRLTAHPGQYNVISAKDQKIIENTTRELNHQAEVFDKMGLNQDSVMVIHGGGTYGNKKQATSRIIQNIKALPEKTKNRLVLENCEMSYNVEDLLSISEELQVPIVIDYHHDSIYPSTNNISYYYERVLEVWKNRNIKPKVHVSNSVPGILETDSKTARRKHSDYIEFLHEELLKIKFPIDVMLECKMKENALLKFREKKFL